MAEFKFYSYHILDDKKDINPYVIVKLILKCYACLTEFIFDFTVNYFKLLFYSYVRTAKLSIRCFACLG